jgi:hypothetical protein
MMHQRIHIGLAVRRDFDHTKPSPPRQRPASGVLDVVFGLIRNTPAPAAPPNSLD